MAKLIGFGGGGGEGCEESEKISPGWFLMLCEKRYLLVTRGGGGADVRELLKKKG